VTSPTSCSVAYEKAATYRLHLCKSPHRATCLRKAHSGHLSEEVVTASLVSISDRRLRRAAALNNPTIQSRKHAGSNPDRLCSQRAGPSTETGRGELTSSRLQRIALANLVRLKELLSGLIDLAPEVQTESCLDLIENRARREMI
jgi:hypothetical protein